MNGGSVPRRLEVEEERDEMGEEEGTRSEVGTQYGWRETPTHSVVAGVEGNV